MKLIKGKNANRGFTLTELIVVMGLSIVVLTLMVTMLSIFTAKVDQNRTYHGFYDEVAFCRDEIQEFLSIVDTEGAKVKLIMNTSEGSILRTNIKVGDKTKTVEVRLYGSEFFVPTADTYTVFNTNSTEKTYFNYIDRIVYDIIPVANGRILKCTFVGSYGKDDIAKGTHKTEFSQSMLFILESDRATFDD